MKFTVSLIVTALLSFAFCLLMPWWSIAIAAFIVAFFIPQKPLKAFLCAFTAVFLLWAGLSFWISSNNGHILARKISMLLLQIENPFALVAITGFIGGTVAGLASLAGNFARTKKL